MLDILDKINQEVVRQNSIWGSNRSLPERTWITILLEEVGEVAHASLEHDIDNLKEEIIQVAAVCVSFLNSLELNE